MQESKMLKGKVIEADYKKGIFSYKFRYNIYIYQKRYLRWYNQKRWYC